ncbi:MAG: hypothetical protein JXK05_09695 [Campylobacterales bacterium]|nr:hypothetical protein [Campylobacterales bacterium]
MRDKRRDAVEQLYWELEAQRGDKRQETPSISLSDYEYRIIQSFLAANATAEITIADLLKAAAKCSGIFTSSEIDFFDSKGIDVRFADLTTIPAEDGIYLDRTAHMRMMIDGEAVNIDEMPLEWHRRQYAESRGNHSVSISLAPIVKETLKRGIKDAAPVCGDSLSCFYKLKMIELGIYPAAMRDVLKTKVFERKKAPQTPRDQRIVAFYVDDSEYDFFEAVINYARLRTTKKVSIALIAKSALSNDDAMRRTLAGFDPMSGFAATKMEYTEAAIMSAVTANRKTITNSIAYPNIGEKNKVISAAKDAQMTVSAYLRSKIQEAYGIYPPLYFAALNRPRKKSKGVAQAER